MKECTTCGSSFTAVAPNARYCGEECRDEAALALRRNGKSGGRWLAPSQICGALARVKRGDPLGLIAGSSGVSYLTLWRWRGGRGDKRRAAAEWFLAQRHRVETMLARGVAWSAIADTVGCPEGYNPRALRVTYERMLSAEDAYQVERV